MEKRDELVGIISRLVGLLSDDQKHDLFNKLTEDKQGIPISAFNTNLSGLEVITVFLKDIREMSVKDIAKALDRKQSTIYTTYNNAKKKLEGELDQSNFSIIIPVNVFSDRKFSILESLVFYLKDKHDFSLTKIADMLKKNYSTVKTVHRRYQEKCQ